MHICLPISPVGRLCFCLPICEWTQGIQLFLHEGNWIWVIATNSRLCCELAVAFLPPVCSKQALGWGKGQILPIIRLQGNIILCWFCASLQFLTLVCEKPTYSTRKTDYVGSRMWPFSPFSLGSIAAIISTMYFRYWRLRALLISLVLSLLCV